MKYRSKPAEIEAMQWTRPWGDKSIMLQQQAERIVAKVIANGGAARYERQTGEIPEHLIAVRTINGWAYAEPGHYVIQGQARFCPHAEYGQPGHECDGIVDFYPCDPETFDKRWESVS